MGISVENPSFDFGKFKKHQAQIVRVSQLGVQKTLESAGVEMINGDGRIVSPTNVEITLADASKQTLETKNVVIAWGSEPFVLPGINLSDRIITSDGILALQEVPES